MSDPKQITPVNYSKLLEENQKNVSDLIEEEMQMN
jgi:hypothetical protein